MKRMLFAAVIAAIPVLQLHASASAAEQAPAASSRQAPVAPVASHAPTAPAFGPVEQSAMVKQYCTGCHNDRAKAGQLDHLQAEQLLVRREQFENQPFGGRKLG